VTKPHRTTCLVSIIIPLLNRGNLIRETMLSVLKQTDNRWECIVVDDGSNDHGPSIVEEFLTLDIRFRFFRNQLPNHNASVCRNLGLSEATGNWILFLDSDDLLTCDRIGATLHHSLSCPATSEALLFECCLFKETPGDIGRKMEKKGNYDELMALINYDIPFSTSSFSWKRPAIIALNGFSTQLVRFQDWELHIRTMMRGIQFFSTGMLGYHYRLHDSNMFRIQNPSESRKTAILAFSLVAKEYVKQNTTRRDVGNAIYGGWFSWIYHTFRNKETRSSWIHWLNGLRLQGKFFPKWLLAGLLLGVSTGIRIFEYVGVIRTQKIYIFIWNMIPRIWPGSYHFNSIK